MGEPAIKYVTPDEYLALEREALEKSEYCRGEIFAMAGAREAHNLIVANLVRVLGNIFIKEPCKVYPPDMKVHVHKEDFFTYPDVSIVCGIAEFYDDTRDVLLNPEVIIEVLSPTTEKYDRGKKFELYRNNPHIKEYILVSTQEKKIESYLKRENDWSYMDSSKEAQDFPIRSLKVALNLEDIYAKVEWETE
jgi:Uma2 family endonuclease